MNKPFDYERLEKNLPDYYNKGKNSNIAKIFKLVSYARNGFDEEIRFLERTLDIRTATGKTLDLYGEIYGQPRGKMDDDKYRLFILLRIAQNMAGSDHTSIINALVSALGIPAETFRLKDAEKSGNVDVDIFPYDVLQAAGITPQQVRDIVEDMLAVGVSLYNLNVSHELPETSLYISNAAVFGESFTIQVVPKTETDFVTSLYVSNAVVYDERFNVGIESKIKSEFETKLNANAVLTHGEFYKLEVTK